MEQLHEKVHDEWIRPWETDKFNNLYNRDERFFSIVVKGLLNWLNRNVILYGKPIKHFVFNTGSSYMYVETNGYEYSMNETSGEDQIYMSLPRCVVEIGNINIPFEELTSPYSRGNYERVNKNEVKGYNAQIRRMPIEMSIDLHYVLANFNESMILLQEIIDKLAFQKYFNIVYLGQVIQCSFEIPSDFTIQLNKIDMTSPDDHNKHVDISLKVCSNYPCIDPDTEINSNRLIAKTANTLSLYVEKDITNVTDYENYENE